MSQALVVEGGAMRGIFTTGLLDEFLEHKFNPFQMYCGVSAGALNLSAYLAGMKERNLRLYTEFATHPDFMSFKRFLAGGHLLDMDWLFQMMDRHVRLDHQKIAQHNFHVGITDVNQAKTLFQRAKADTLDNLLKITSCLPIYYRGFPQLNGRAMTDGGMADAIPVRHAIEQGAKQIMVVRSRLKDYRQKTTLFDYLLAYQFRNRPKLSALMKRRAQNYNDTVALIRNPPKGIEILEVCPPDQFKTSRLDRSKDNLYRGYEMGKNSAQKVIEQWQQLIQKHGL